MLYPYDIVSVCCILSNKEAYSTTHAMGEEKLVGVATSNRILEVLGLTHVGNFSQLQYIVRQFRQQQQLVLFEILVHLKNKGALLNTTNQLQKSIDLKIELEVFLNDLLKMHNYIKQLKGSDMIYDQMLQLYGSFGKNGDRRIVTKIFQTMEFDLVPTLYTLLDKLTFLQKLDFLAHFGENPSELRYWLAWVDSLSRKSSSKEGDDSSSQYTVILDFFYKCLQENMLEMWMKSLKIHSSMIRAQVIMSVKQYTPRSLKKLIRFCESFWIPLDTFMTLHPLMIDELPHLLEEFPTVTLATVISKFNSEEMLSSLKQSMQQLLRKELFDLLDCLALAEVKKVESFFIALVASNQIQDITRFFMSLTVNQQMRFLHLVATMGIACDTASFDLETNQLVLARVALISLLVRAPFKNFDQVMEKLQALRMKTLIGLLLAIQSFMPEEIRELSTSIELMDLSSLNVFLSLFQLPSKTDDKRILLAKCGQEVPGSDSIVFFEMLKALEEKEASQVLRIVAALKRREKERLFKLILQNPLTEEKNRLMNRIILLFLGESMIPLKKLIRLFCAIPCSQYGSLISLLRSQHSLEQGALTTLMLGLSSTSNGQMIFKLMQLDSNSLDHFFQILAIIPNSEHKTIAILAVSTDVTVVQFKNFVQIAANVMNKSSTREFVQFTGALPPRIRTLFFDMMENRPEKGVLMRIVSCSSNLHPEDLNALVTLLHRMSWETRSALIEQIRAIDSEEHKHQLMVVIQELSEQDLQKLVHLFNYLQTNVRCNLITLLTRLTPQERTLAIRRLDEMPKERSPKFCVQITDPSCKISIEMLKILGRLDPSFQKRLLEEMNQNETCCILIQIMSECGMDDSYSVNILAQAVSILQSEDHFQLLYHVILEALANDLPLSEFSRVISHFSSDQVILCDFLKYVKDFTKYNRSLLLFKILYIYSDHAKMLYDIFHTLDLDDTIFVLKKIRTFQSIPESHEIFIQALSDLNKSSHGKKGVLKDEFCSLILGYHHRTPRLQRNIAKERILPVNYVCQTTQLSPASRQKLMVRRSFLGRLQPLQDEVTHRKFWEVLEDDKILSPSHRKPLCIQQHMHLIKTPIISNRLLLDFQVDGNPSSFAQFTHSDTENTGISISQNAAEDDKELEAVGSTQLLSTLDTEKNCTKELPVTNKILPEIVRVPAYLTDISHDFEHDNHLSHPQNVSGLTRSESAPSPLVEFSATSPGRSSKKCRGIYPATKAAPEFHIMRGRGNGIFKKDCELAELSSTSKIRYSKSKAAQDHIFDARLQLALGRRRNNDTTIPYLSKSNGYTMDRAIETIADAAAFRAIAPRGFS